MAAGARFLFWWLARSAAAFSPPSGPPDSPGDDGGLRWGAVRLEWGGSGLSWGD